VSGDRQGDVARTAEARTPGKYPSATPAGCPSRHPSRRRLLAPSGGGGAASPQGARRAMIHRRVGVLGGAAVGGGGDLSLPWLPLTVLRYGRRAAAQRGSGR